MILTDVRPVYSPSRNEIVGGIVCNKMRLRYQNEDGTKSLTIAMDRDEIERLEKICNDALTKIKQASNLLSAAELPSFIMGEEYDVLWQYFAKYENICLTLSEPFPTDFRGAALGRKASALNF